MSENLPVSWQEEMAAQARAFSARERPSVSQISTRSGILAYQGQQIPGNKLQCIIVGSVFENRYYIGPFDANNMQAPKCYALSVNDENMVPHANVKEPQGATCAQCPQNQWGSDPRNKPGQPIVNRGKACKSLRRIALLPSSVLQDKNVKTAEMALLSIPVTSTKNWANYVNNVAADYQRPPWGLISEISISPHMRFQFEIKFQTVGKVQDDLLGDIFKRTQTCEEVLLAPYESTGEVSGAPLGDVKQRKF